MMIIQSNETETNTCGKASLAEIFFQKLFGKRRASQNNSYRAYSINYKYTSHTADNEQQSSHTAYIEQ